MVKGDLGEQAEGELRPVRVVVGRAGPMGCGQVYVGLYVRVCGGGGEA